MPHTNEKKKIKEPNYREIFLRAADQMWTQIRCGSIDIDGALGVLRYILEQANEQGKRRGILFEKK